MGLTEGGIWLPAMRRGTRNEAPKGAFLTAAHPIRLVGTAAHTLQIFSKDYFSNLSMMSARRAPSALAILAQVKIVGMRLWLSIKLIAGRLNPVFSASFSWERPCSLRKRASSLTTFSTSNSEDLSRMRIMIPDLQRLL